ncbi:MAG TPA: L-histidine N(alpha)-methyltransferase, partial [Vicinamibacterales bacterium]|nr:L-histidine N(alpha)-methyltransferase [Vicinamibacterales bacterium]
MTPHTTTVTASARDAAEPREQANRGERLEFAEAVRFYLQLSPKQLPSRFLYDTLGSALFDAICHLPWYRITRAELQLLQRHAPAIGQVLRHGGRVVEPGCGNGEKLATLLTHARVPGVRAHLIDLSEAALAHAVQTLAAIDGLDISVATHRATYEDGLLGLPPAD